MALHYDVSNSLRELREAKQDLELSLSLNYKEGARVSFCNPNQKNLPVYTGTLLYFQLDLNSETAIAAIEVDQKFLPLVWDDNGGITRLLRINILNPEYDITIID